MKNELFLGVSVEKITPKVGAALFGYAPDVFSTEVHDDLSATAFYFQQGNTQALMVSITVCSINTAISNSLLQMIEERCGIPKEHIILHATHTHSGPNVAGMVGWGDIDEEYLQSIFIPALLSVVEKAMENKKAVKMAVSVGDSAVGINRRELSIKNEVHLGQNPWGPVDPRMTMLSFVDDQGAPVANMIHYGCHGTSAGRNHEISRDWSGIMLDTMEECYGGVSAFFNGAEGDVGPRMPSGRTVGERHVHYITTIGGMAAQDAAKIYRQKKAYQSVSLSVSNEVLRIPLDRRVDREYAAEMCKRFEGHTVNIQAQKLHYYRDIVRSYEEGYEDRPFFEVAQTVIKLGDVAFVSFPFEIFTVIGMRIDQASSIPYVLSLSNTNGTEGYFATQDQICLGGYEIDCYMTAHLQPFVPNADWHLVTETLNHLQKLIQQEEE